MGSRHTNGYEMVSEAMLLGFDAIEVSHGTSVALFPGIIQALKKKRIRIAGVHNFCPSPVELQIDAPDAYEITSHRKEERARALKLSQRSIETAAQFGAAYVVMHLGGTPIRPVTGALEQMVARGEIYSRGYVKEKLAFIEAREKAGKLAMKRIREALDLLAPEAEKHGVILALESRSHYEQAPTEEEMEQLLAEYPSASVGYWHDFGHVQRKANLGLLDHEQWLARMRGRLIGCHLHDVIWPARDHYVPFQGNIDYERLVPLLPKEIPLVWELHPRRKSTDIKEALQAWKERFGN